MPKGGPDGGDGGRGGDVVLVCDDSLRDLQSFRRRAPLQGRARRARRGRAAPRRATARRSWSRVPPGTAGADAPGRHPLRPRAPGPARRGGARRRGRARQQAASPPPRARRRASPSAACPARRRVARAPAQAARRRRARRACRTPASRRCSRALTRARPKVADYPFTTLEPVLGTLELDDRQLVIADIPGLIEGASEGAGLGHDFLAHVERTRLLVHVLDLAPLDGSDPVANHETIERELARARPAAGGAAAGAGAVEGRPRATGGRGGGGGRALAGRGSGRRCRWSSRRARPGDGLDELRRRCSCARVPVEAPVPEERAAGRGAGRAPGVPARRPGRASTSSAWTTASSG